MVMVHNLVNVLRVTNGKVYVMCILPQSERKKESGKKKKKNPAGVQ